LAVILLGMGMIAVEKEKGTAALLFSKPVRRCSVVVAKSMAAVATLSIGLFLGAVANAIYTAILFEALPPGRYISANILLLVVFAFYLTLALFASSLAKTQAQAAAGSFVGLILFLTLGVIPRLDSYLPGRLSVWSESLLLGGDLVAWGALFVTAALIALLLAGACYSLSQEEF
jgi:ABC-2 type transport system permease protein